MNNILFGDDDIVGIWKNILRRAAIVEIEEISKIIGTHFIDVNQVRIVI